MKSKAKQSKTADSTTSETPQDHSYWIHRPLNDTERDWKDTTDNWVADYWLSKNHPHRSLILQTLSKLQFASLGEVGCHAGPNLGLIQDALPHVTIRGIDVSAPSI